MAIKNDFVNQLAQEYDRFEPQFLKRDPAWLKTARQESAMRFKKRGLPTLHDENWKYTHLGFLAKQHYQVGLNQSATPSESVKNQLKAMSLNQANARCVIVDGQYCAALSTIDKLGGGITIQPLNQAYIDTPQKIQAAFQHASTLMSTDAPFIDINTAFVANGLFIHVSTKHHVELPIHLIVVTTPQSEQKLLTLRNIIQLEANSNVTLIESYIHCDDAHYFMNVVNNVQLADNAKLTHLKIQQESTKSYHVANTAVQQAKNSDYQSFAVDLGGQLVRNDLQVDLVGEGANTVLNGLYILEARQHVDNHTAIIHQSSLTESSELYKGILQGRSHAVFNGKVVVEKGISKIDSAQANHNLLLSEFSEVDTKPELQIYADDVKCSHGATVGQLNEDALFYLLSRGVDKLTATHLLIYGFVEEVISPIESPELRKLVNQAIINHLPEGERVKEIVQL